MSQNCEKCGAVIPEGAKFCPECGTKYEPIPAVPKCASCGTPLEAGARFCPECGQATTAVPASVAAPTPQPAQAIPYAQPVQQSQPVYAQPIQQARPVQQYQQPNYTQAPNQPYAANTGYQQQGYQQQGYQQQSYQQPLDPGCTDQSYFRNGVPTDGKVGFGDAIKYFFLNYVKFSGRASKSEFWLAVLFNIIVSTVASFIPYASYVVTLAFLLPGLSLTIRRLHDIGKDWYWIFMSLIPLAGFIIMIVYCCKDSEGDNQWGPGPQSFGTPYGTPNYTAPQQPYNNMQ